MFEGHIYSQRRQRLMNQMGSGLLLLPGNVDAPRNYFSNTYAFRQDSHFLYFVGLDQPDLWVVMDVDAGEVVLFGDDWTMDDIIWTGPVPSLSERAYRSNIDSVRPLSALNTYVSSRIKRGQALHFLPPYRMENRMRLLELTGLSHHQLDACVSVPFIKAVVNLRSIKGPEEIEALQEASAIGYEMHMAVLKGAHPGVREQDLAGRIEGIAWSKGAGVSFASILSQKGEVLHGHDHSGVLEKGKLLLCDAGAESNLHYASDFTRTIPVGGRFNTVQRALYQLVLDANNRAFECIRPGVLYRDVHLEACLVLAEGLKSMGLMKGDMQAAVQSGAHALFMVHGLGHMMGLDVHDMEDLGEAYVGYDDEIQRSAQFGLRSLRLGRRLQTGFVLTIEPGLYFIPDLIRKWKAEQIHSDFICYGEVERFIGTGGIRLEDDVWVGETGAIRLGQNRLPIHPDEIEALYR